MQQQQLALHLIYIKKLLQPRKEDFVTPILIRCIQIHTGHQSILPIIMFPNKYKKHLNNIPTLAHLCSVVAKLPPLRPHTTWPKEWLYDLPLCDTLIDRGEGGESLPTYPSNIRSGT